MLTKTSENSAKNPVRGIHTYPDHVNMCDINIVQQTLNILSSTVTLHRYLYLCMSLLQPHTCNIPVNHLYHVCNHVGHITTYIYLHTGHYTCYSCL